MSAPRYPVSIKGVMLIDGRIPLLFNERREWELPGGRLESGEQPEQALEREIAEEMNVRASAGAILDSWLYDVAGSGQVLIVTYACRVLDASWPRLSHEHKALELFAPDAVAGLPMPQGYKNSIARFMALGL